MALSFDAPATDLLWHAPKTFGEPTTGLLFAYLTDESGNYLTDESGNRLTAAFETTYIGLHAPATDLLWHAGET